MHAQNIALSLLHTSKCWKRSENCQPGCCKGTVAVQHCSTRTACRYSAQERRNRVAAEPRAGGEEWGALTVLTVLLAGRERKLPREPHVQSAWSPREAVTAGCVCFPFVCFSDA